MTDKKHCSLNDGQALIGTNERRVSVGGGSAIIHISNYADSVKGIEHLVWLDLDSTTSHPEASAGVQAIIERLFPECLTDPNARNA